jgi:hypothetical protein
MNLRRLKDECDVGVESSTGPNFSDLATNQDLASQNVPTSLLTQNNFRFARHPTGIADSTLPSLWSNADFRRSNIDALRRGLHNPLPRGGVAAEQVVSALAVDVIDGLHSTASGRFFAWVIGGALSAALDADWLTAAWDQNAYNYVTGPAAAVVEECEPQTACGH